MSFMLNIPCNATNCIPIGVTKDSITLIEFYGRCLLKTGELELRKVNSFLKNGRVF